MNKDDIKFGVGVWLFNPSGQVLLGCRLSKHGFNTWSAPGGKPEANENFIDTAIRETFEETGIKLTADMLQFVCETDDVFEDSHFLTTHYRADNITAIPVVMEKNKCAEWKWFDKDNLPDNLFLSARNLMNKKVL